MSELLLPVGARLTHESEIKRSRFLALVARAETPELAREIIATRRSSMPDARHHCTAFVVSTCDARAVSHSSDDGEPSGTAGRPMLDVLAGTGIVDVVAVVTRYFGGTLLGTGGLVRAYSEAVRQCLEGAQIVTRERLSAWSMFLPHADAGRYLAELSAAGFTTEADYLPDGVRALVVSNESAQLSGLVSRLSSGTIGVEARGSRVVERPAGRIVAGRATLDCPGRR